jgi:hypothetical protein
MGRKRTSDKLKEMAKKGADRIRRFEENQEKPKKKKEIVPEGEGDGMVCQTYWERDIRIDPDDEWIEKFYYYKRKPKTDKKFEI